MIPLIDGHLDLAWNATGYGRDQTLPLATIREHESALPLTDRETATVCLPELRLANVRMAVATLFARAIHGKSIADCLLRTNSDSPARSIAHASAHAQLAYYRLLVRQGHLRILTDAEALQQHWSASPALPDDDQLGCIILMECADPLTNVDELPLWHEAGVRAICLAHFGPGHYAMGNVRDGIDTGLTDPGRELLDAMQQLGTVLDMSHLSDRSFAEAAERYTGPVCATHCNTRRLTPGDRQLSDPQLRHIISRDGVIGAVIHNGMLHRDWQQGVTARNLVSLRDLTDHIDHVCQIAGDALHVAIGSDLDGGYGLESCPGDFDTIADLQKIAPLLSDRGFRDHDIADICYGNWLRFWQAALSPSPPEQGTD